MQGNLNPFLPNLYQHVKCATRGKITKKWSDEADAKLQDCFAITDWNMFQDSPEGIEEYTTSVNGFINKCIDEFVPTATVRTYIRQPEAMDFRQHPH